MASGINQLTNDFAYVQVVSGTVQVDRCQAIYKQHCDRVFSLAFYMTDSEPQAEELVTRTFCRAFAASDTPSGEMIDRALVSELKQETAFHDVTLNCVPRAEMLVARRNVKRVFLERAVVSLPATERMVFLMHDVENYDHPRIGRLLGISVHQSHIALNQARLCIRELVADMQQ